MSPIDQYLDGLERRLFVRRRARRGMLEEMRGHIEALEAARGAAFPDAEAIAAAFGSQPALARRINAAVPWRQAQLPWRLPGVGLSAMVFIMLLSFPATLLSSFLAHHGIFAEILHVVVNNSPYLLGLFGGSAAAMVYSARAGARPLHRWVSVLAPCALVAYSAIGLLICLLHDVLYDFDGILFRYAAFKLLWNVSCVAMCVAIACVATRTAWSALRARAWLLAVTAAAMVVTAVASPPSTESLRYGQPLAFLLPCLLVVWLVPILARRAVADPVAA